MAKRFVNPDWKALRSLSPNLQRAYFYCWDKADACGMYEHDPVYMKADLGIALSIQDLAKLPGAKVVKGEKIFFTDFIEVNYGKLKEGYNPHKPAFRALEKNKISSLDQACVKLEDEEEEEDVKEEEDEDVKEEEDEEEDKGRPKILNPFGSNLPEWDGWKQYKLEEHRERYKSPKTELAALTNLFKLANGDPAAAREIIETSIANRWKGLFELKTKNGNSKAKSGNIATSVQEAFNRRFNEV